MGFKLDKPHGQHPGPRALAPLKCTKIPPRASQSAPRKPKETQRKPPPIGGPKNTPETGGLCWKSLVFRTSSASWAVRRFTSPTAVEPAGVLTPLPWERCSTGGWSRKKGKKRSCELPFKDQPKGTNVSSEIPSRHSNLHGNSPALGFPCDTQCGHPRGSPRDG